MLTVIYITSHLLICLSFNNMHNCGEITWLIMLTLSLSKALDYQVKKLANNCNREEHFLTIGGYLK